MESAAPLRSQADGSRETGCAGCGSATYIQAIMDKFGERVCRACVRETDGFRTVTQTTAKAEYLLSLSDLAVMPSELKPNPRNTRFRDMRLYLLKQLVRQSRSRASALLQHAGSPHARAANAP